VRRWAALATTAFGVLVLAVAYAEPVLDGDLFWHLAYAEQMVDDATLVPDPTIYSWTPTSDRTIYCAWLGELVLFGIHGVAGLAGLFALRYAVVAAVLLVIWWYARRRGLGARPVTALVLLVTGLGIYAGTIIKPELFSLLAFTLVVGAWARGRLVARAGGDPRRWFAAVPLVLLVWANTHGAFAVAGAFLVATAAGELLNARLTPELALPAAARRWLLGCWAACLVAVCVTPYGPRYPIQLVGDNVFGGLARPDVAVNVAHNPIWDDSALGLHLIDLLVVVAVLTGVALWRRRSAFDWTWGLALLAYVPLYLAQVRTTWFLPVVAAFAVTDLRAEAREADAADSWSASRWVPALAIVAFVALGSRAVHGAYATPHEGAWLGFGIGYTNPEPEADYLARPGHDRERLGPRLYNLFDAGGYLLWRLHPRDQVMVDSRSFPYLSWFDDQQDFAEGRDVEGFLAEYPANVAVIDLDRPRTWQAFLGLDDWRLGFYGPSAAVFLRDREATLLADDDELWAWRTDLRNVSAALDAFELSTFVGDYPTAWTILEELEGDLALQVLDRDRGAAADDYRAGYAALLEADHGAALDHFRAAFRDRVPSARDQLVIDLLAGLAEGTLGPDDVTEAERTLADLARPADLDAPQRAPA